MDNSGKLQTRLQDRLRERVARQSNTKDAVRYQWPEEPSRAREIGEAHTSALTEKRFPCQQCGGMLHYAIGTRSLECQYCGHTNAIAANDTRIRELDLKTALRQLQNAGRVSAETHVIVCPNCAANFALDAHIHAGECPFCGTTVITSTSRSKSIKPKGLLPFSVTSDEATDSYRRWLKKLWLAPNELKKYARSDAALNGVYIPYWTYDSQSATAYHGQRGDVYYVTQSYTATVNGRRVRRTRQVPKIRWSPVSGRTSRHFDDVLVGATRTLPRKITDWLAPWDLENLQPYTEEYLSGFSSEVYQVSLDEGFNIAQKTMDERIRSDVRRSIGGDQQRITRLNTQHSDTTFKHVLLPLWTAGFQFRDKTYRFVVNGRTGKVRGERPWSRVKIALLVLAGAVLAAGLLTLAASSQSGGGFERGLGGRLGRGFDDGFRIEWGAGAGSSRPNAPIDGRFPTRN